MGSASPPSAVRSDLPGGIVATRRALRRVGGLVAAAGAGVLWLVAAAVDAIVPGVVGGAVSFVMRTVAVPFLPVFGLPVATDSWRLGAAVAASAVLWWFLGTAASRRVTARVVAGWREWVLETLLLGAGAVAGSLASFGVAAAVIGVL